MKKKAFSIVESLISLLVVAAVSMSTLYIIGSFEKTKLKNDRRLSSLLEIAAITEELKAEPTLGNAFALQAAYSDFDIKIIAVGKGAVVRSGSTISISGTESDPFSRENLKNNLYRIVIGKDGQSITTIIYSTL